MKNDFEIRGNITAIFLKNKEEILEALIDTIDLPLVSCFPGKWYANYSKETKGLYVTISDRIDKIQKTFYLHRVVLNVKNEMQADHINHNTLDNRKSNLRLLTITQNQQNRKGAQSNSKSGIRGVSWSKEHNLWRSTVRINGKQVFQKYFKNINDAKLAVIKARKEIMPFASNL